MPMARRSGTAFPGVPARTSGYAPKIGAITARLVRLGLITEDGVVQPG
jgi:hypothetical protein